MFKKQIFSFYVACLFLNTFAYSNKHKDLHIAPYVLNVDSSSAQIKWVSNCKDFDGNLSIRELPNSNICISTRSVIETNKFIHTALLKDLSPFTEYHYSLNLGGNRETGRFMTAAPKGSRIEFVIYGDTRTYAERHKLVSDAIAHENPMFVICSGDFVTSGEKWGLWKKEFFDPASNYLSKSTLWPVRGNHEKGPLYYSELFETKAGKEFYSFNFGDLHVVVLDQYISPAKEQEMLKWLEDDLKEDDSKWKIVCYHTPSFNIGGHASSWGKADFLPIIEKYNVDLVLSGHSHIYERFVPISDPEHKPVIHVVSGGGGANTYPPVPHPLLEGGIGISELHYCHFVVEGNTLLMTVKMPCGEIIDELKLVKNRNVYQKKIMDKAVGVKYANNLLELFADFDADFNPGLPQINQPTEIIVNAANWTEGASITISNSKLIDTWQVKEQTVIVSNGKFRLSAKPNVKLDLGVDNYDQPLKFRLKCPDEGIVESIEVELVFSQNMLIKMTPKPDPVPITFYEPGIVVDGILSDWSPIAPFPLPYENLEESEFRFCWNENGLYGSYHIVDDMLKIDENNLYNGDCLELFLDKKNLKSEKLNEFSEQIIFSPQPLNNGGVGLFVVYSQNDSSTYEEIQCSWQPTEFGYSLEFFYPSKALNPVELCDGYEIGFNFTLSNNGKVIRTFYCDKNAHQGYKHPFLWGTAMFVNE